MSDNGLPSELVEQTASGSPPSSVPCFVRAASEIRVALGRAGPEVGTRVRSLFETGGLRLKFPNAGGACEGVLVNTAGGLTGGDHARFTLDIDADATARITTQSAEKIYRSDGPPTSVEARLRLAAGATFAWLPQETILFDGARLERRLDVDLATNAQFTLLETLVFGRAAKGERVEQGVLRDRWRIRRGGRLVLAEDVRLDGGIASLLESRATGAGARAVATLVHVASDADDRLDDVRASLEMARSDCGASAWNGLLVARFSSADASDVRGDAARALLSLLRSPLPRVWSC